MKHQARRRFGQNFLQDANVINRIIHSINPQATDHIVEIGPGLGALTHPLAHTDVQLDLVELDRDLIIKLEKLYKTYTNVTITNADALKFDFHELSRHDKKLRIVGNLPYNISTPLLFHLIDQIDVIKDMHFMLQKEVVDRLAAQPGGSDYGRLGIMVQYFCQVEALFTVDPSAFKPMPKVDSAIVRLIPHKELPYPSKNLSKLRHIVMQAFNQRRKVIRNSLKGIIDESQLQSLGIDPMTRPERISIEDFVALSNLM